MFTSTRVGAWRNPEKAFQSWVLSVRLETSVLISGLFVNHSLKDLLNTYAGSANTLGCEGPALNKTLEKGDSKSLTAHSLATALSASL